MSRKRKIDGAALLEAAIELSHEYGYSNVTREQIATKAGVATGSVNLYFGTMHKLRKTIVRHAIRTNNQRIVAQAILAGDGLIDKLDSKDRLAALTAYA